MAAELRNSFDSLLGCKSFICDSASWKVVSRPRLWWSSALCPPTPLRHQELLSFGGVARWRFVNKQWQVIPASPLFPAQVPCNCPCATFNSEVSSGKLLFPCLTTPAETPGGRDSRARCFHLGNTESMPCLLSKANLPRLDLRRESGCKTSQSTILRGLRAPLAAACLGTRGTQEWQDFCCSAFWCKRECCPLPQQRRAGGTWDWLGPSAGHTSLA